MIKNKKEYDEKILKHSKLQSELYDLECELEQYETIRDADKIEKMLMHGYKIDKTNGNIVGTDEHTNFMCNLANFMKKGNCNVD